MSSINSLSSLSAKTGIGGLVSGMDIDELVENLTSTSRGKILKQKQNVQMLQWKQTAYRSVSTALKEFQSKYLDVLSTTNFKSTSFFNSIKASTTSAALSVTSSSTASAGTITINQIKQLATNQSVKSTSVASKDLEGNLAIDGELTSTDIDMLIANLHNKSIRINLDGKVKSLTFDDTFIVNVYNHSLPPTAEGLSNAFQTLIDKAYGVKEIEDRVINVSITDTMLTMSAPGSQIAVYAIDDDKTVLSRLGFDHGQSNKLTSTTTLEDLPFAVELNNVDRYAFKINNIEFEFNKTDTLSTVLNRINSSKAGVTISYSAITDKFQLVAKESGVGDNIIIEETQGNLINAFGLASATNPIVEYGVNAELIVNGMNTVRNSNTIVIDGVQVTLLNHTLITDPPIIITAKDDASVLMEPIKKFVEDYNSMISLVNGLSKEKVYSDYPPLSEEQKDEMTEIQIEKWEEKAKSGILRGDSILQRMSSRIQSIMYSPAVKGGITLRHLGIVSEDYQENGKLKINEDALKKALETMGTEIRELFTSEKGIAYKLDEVIKEAVKTSGEKGKRGTLTDIAGIASTRSDIENTITEKIGKSKNIITSLQQKLTKEEKRLWNKFTAMETALQRLNSQSSILTQFSNNSN